MDRYRYERDERLPVEVLVIDVDPDHLDEFLELDHEVWTLGEAAVDYDGRIPFRSKEVWLDDAHRGRVTIVFVWDSFEAWRAVDRAEVQDRLNAEFAARFGYRNDIVRAYHVESDYGIHRWSRFERLDEPSGSAESAGSSERRGGDPVAGR